MQHSKSFKETKNVYDYLFECLLVIIVVEKRNNITIELSRSRDLLRNKNKNNTTIDKNV